MSYSKDRSAPLFKKQCPNVLGSNISQAFTSMIRLKNSECSRSLYSEKGLEDFNDS